MPRGGPRLAAQPDLGSARWAAWGRPLSRGGLTIGTHQLRGRGASRSLCFGPLCMPARPGVFSLTPRRTGSLAWVPTGPGPAWAVPALPAPGGPGSPSQRGPLTPALPILELSTLQITPTTPQRRNRGHTPGSPAGHGHRACSGPKTPGSSWTVSRNRRVCTCVCAHPHIHVCTLTQAHACTHAHRPSNAVGVGTAEDCHIQLGLITEPPAEHGAPCQDPHPTDRPESDTLVSFQPLKQ